MIRSQADSWSIARSLAFLAATFAIVFGTLMPFAALAAVQPDQAVILCSADSPQSIDVGGDHQKDKALFDGHCAACIMPLSADLPTPTRIETIRLPLTPVVDAPTAHNTSAPPPARAPPRPHSTAPPHV